MKIDGNEIAKEILQDLKKRVGELWKNGVIPHLAIILAGDDPASVAYVRQKEIKAKTIGALATIYKLEETVRQDEILTLTDQLNRDDSVHGIIVQRPLPSHINPEVINEATNPQKDIDSFHSASPYPIPIAAAVLKILETIYSFSVVPRSVLSSSALHDTQQSPNNNFLQWLRTKKTAIIGKGETGGKPILTTLQEIGTQPITIDSKTSNPDVITQQADIIISAVGKPSVIKPESMKKGVILVSIGLHKETDGKLHADYEEETIKDIASFYTPVPGGVGPVNVAMLLENLVQATENST